MKRRTFLKTSAAAPIVIGGLTVRASSSMTLLAQMPSPENDRILIIIQLFGGNDGLNTVIPALDDEYYKIRPTLAVAKADCWNNIGNIFLHPALEYGSKGGIAHMLELGTLAIVQGVGYDNPNLSHFRSTDIRLSGINDSRPDARLDTGWVGRYLESRYPDFPASLPDHPLAVQFGGSFSLTLLGTKGRMGIEVTDPSGQLGVVSQLDTLDTGATGTDYALEYAFVADIANRSNKYAQAVRDAYAAGKTKLTADYGKDSLGTQMASVAALIAGGLKTKVYVVSIGGFDTHVSQQLPGNAGMHPSLLAELADGVAQFTYDMTKLGQADRVVGLTISEFGRRPHENGSRGTDHGAASVQFVFGTQVNSGAFGNPPDLKNLDANSDLYYQVDYREVYAEILTDWFDLTTDEMHAVLRDDTVTPIDVLKSQISGVRTSTNGAGMVSILGSYPNPFASSAVIDIQFAAPTHARLELANLNGQRVATLADGWFTEGVHRVPISVDIPSGPYLCTLQTGDRRVVRAVTCVR